MTLESRNAATMRSAQARYDNASPPDDYDVTDNLTQDDYDEARAELLEDYDADDITDAMVKRRAISNYESQWNDECPDCGTDLNRVFSKHRCRPERDE